ncbi:hypothetical protein [Helicobacter colisuis]|uniref:Sugar transferase n=1 Tax=Helicobacter colisuis TaxID=2949739 RepID=A0ABT0TV41_9HELI|nr:hypothetical protein [Helicobacter colisuis]MCL9819801.1 hypothetical protein [Helicobacter colisuis]
MINIDENVRKNSENNVRDYIDSIVLNSEKMFNNITQYCCEKYSKNETNELIFNMIQKQYNKLLDFAIQKSKDREFMLCHPIYNVQSYAISSFYDGGLTNFLLMVDKDFKHPWIIVQQYCFINYLIIDSNIFRVQGNWLNLGALKNICHLKEFCDENNREFLFALGNHRPYHFFSHLYSHYVGVSGYINQNKIKFIKPFYKPDSIDDAHLDNEKYIMVWLYLVPIDYVMTTYEKEFVKSFSSVYTDSCRSDLRLQNEFDLSIWFGIPGQRRAWLEQWEGIPLILKNLSQYFSSIKVFIDGMTAYDGERIEVKENLQDFWRIVENIKKVFEVKDSGEYTESSFAIFSPNGTKIALESLSGYDYRTKIQCCSMCDIAISEVSTTGLTPFAFCKKPGVVLIPLESYREHITTKGELQGITHTHIKKTAKQYHQVVDYKGPFYFNYHIVWQHLYNLAAEVLEELSRENKLKVKNLKMHRLEVPKVELIVKQYKLEKQFEIKIPLENVEFVDKLATQLHQQDQIIQTKTQELTSKTQQLTQTKNQLDSAKIQLNSTQKELDSTKQQLDSKVKELSSLPIKKQTLEIKNLEQDNLLKQIQIQEAKQDLINKQLHTKQLEKELGYESNVLQELELKNQELIQTKNQLDSTKKQLDSKTKELESANKILISNPNTSHFIQNTSNFKGKLAYLNTLATAKDRIHNHLSYKLGQAMIENSKSLLGYIRMPYVLSYIKDKHKQEQQQYQEAIKKNPNLKLPNLESYPDYQESLKEKECLTYKLGEAFIKASKTWYKGGYVKLLFEIRKLKGEI